VAEFLLEIGCEEIPASWLAGLGEQLRTRFADLAAKETFVVAEVRSFWTPRRLVLVADVPLRQEDRVEAVWGPAREIAQGDAGFKPPGLGFAKKCGIAPEAIEFRKKPGQAGETLYAVFDKKIPGRAALEVLPGLITGLLRGLAFPKRMSWDAWLDDGKGAFPFGRPIRWIVALVDGQVVPVTIFALVDGKKGAAIVESGRRSQGHRFLPRGKTGQPIEVGSFAELQSRLREHCVILDPAERAAAIQAALASSHELVEEWRDLVEHPAIVFGTIPAEFQSLPREVLETVLVHHQKYVPIAAGATVAKFAAVTDTDGSNAAEIVRGMERVIVARLRDGRFFFNEDRKRPLADRVDDLVGVTFHQKLGSYREKADRLVALVDVMGAKLGLLTKPEHEAAREAARLAKADLTTLMVREFTELQGVMGGIYLRAEGERWESVASAVRWHYHPVSVDEDAAPAKALAGSDATVFGAVSVADKLDTLAGYFGIGQMPTGSSDPYGLRRAAQGVVRVLLDFWSAQEAEKRPDLRLLVDAAVKGYGDKLPRKAAEIVPELEGFLLDRLRYVMVARGYPGDEVDAVLGAREPDALENPHEAWVRLKALHRVRGEARADFEALAAAFKRARNILGDRRDGKPEASLFQEAAEGSLFEAVSARAAEDGGYEARLRALSGLRAPVDKFFDDVHVMAEDPKLRENRLGLLAKTLSLFYRIADISKLGGQA
jgi:glycyl-tRNA synthetase beta chain